MKAIKSTIVQRFVDSIELKGFECIDFWEVVDSVIFALEDRRFFSIDGVDIESSEGDLSNISEFPGSLKERIIEFFSDNYGKKIYYFVGQYSSHYYFAIPEGRMLSMLKDVYEDISDVPEEF